MANIQIGKYKRPGIFIEEFDKSVIVSPNVEGISNLVIGVSKKGPVNAPVRLTNLADMEAIFGPLDRSLERKGSFFHRTVSKMLESSTVYAMNLLLTDDTLDLIEYKSISAAAGYNNDIKREGPYRKIFDTTGFWRRDTESFLTLANSNFGYTERAFNLTNLSDRPITVFVFKSKMTGFDRTLLEWYGSVEKMPTYVNTQDYASDYMVDVLVVGGDWSNYQELSVDSRWSPYFSNNGLRKDNVRDFANDANVTLLAYYEGLSLIPYFRDLNGNNIFIETIINRDIDKTGLFCAFNNDIVEDDYYNGKLDLLGNTIVGVDDQDIEFLSYKETITENVVFTTVPLDLPGNVTALLSGLTSYNDQGDHTFGGNLNVTPVNTTGTIQNSNRTAWFAEGSVYRVSGGESTSSYNSDTITVEYSVDTDAFAIIGDNKIDLTDGTVSLSISAGNYPSSSATVSYVGVAVLDSTGEISMKTSQVIGENPSVNTSDIILGYATFSIYGGNITELNYIDVTVDDVGFKDLTNGSDYSVTDEGNGTLKIEFLGTNATPDVTQYEQYRKFKVFNRMIGLLDSSNLPRMAMLLDDSNYTKYRLENSSISDIITNNTENKSFKLNTTLSSSDLDFITTNGYLVFYTVDNEVILGQDGLETKNERATTDIGVVAKNSTLYNRFYDGIINTKDFFFKNRLYVDSNQVVNDLLGSTVDVTFIKGEDTPNTSGNYDGISYIVFYSDKNFDGLVELLNGDKIQVPDSSLNKGVFTIIVDEVGLEAPWQLAKSLGYDNDVSNPTSGYYAYPVAENVILEQNLTIDRLIDYEDRAYLKMYLENNGDMILTFYSDESLTSTTTIEIEANNTFFVNSRKSNFKQTIEIEVPNGYVREPNKILVKADRYPELKVGDFLEAYVDSNDPSPVPRKLTRVLSKRQYALDPTLSEITCDARILVYNFGNNDLQTMRYLGIDNYALTYKAISLKGFKMRQESLPNGSEERQNQILNLVAKGTPLFKALTNKEAIDFRYLVDSFGLGLVEKSKQQLVDICGERLDVFGFINMPSVRMFKKSVSPSFVDGDGVLQTEFVAQGGNLETNPTFLYSFGDGSGVTSVGYFTPYVTLNDNGKVIDVPPAPYVATTYMRKHISGVTSITPWTIAAGVTNGRVTNILGLETLYSNSDIEYLNQAQMNPLVFKKNRGYVIETENSAQTLYRSSLSYIHVREVLIELERQLSRMLLDFQWRFNTPDVRAEIKLRADAICDSFVSRNGLYNYFNKIDDENNTSELIDNQIGVLDTYVEPIKGMGIIVNNITILRTGAISAGGFINA